MKTPRKWLQRIARDADLEQDVRAELDYDQSVGRVGSAEVEVSDGVVSVTGTVYSLAQKWAVEHAIRRVASVTEVINDLRVDPPKEIFHSDQEIADAVTTVLDWTAGVPDGIDVLVLDGRVTLNGTVGFLSERIAAAAAVRPLVGVIELDNRLVVASVVGANDIAANVARAIHRHTGGVEISVDYDGGTVTLEGVALSWAVRARAEEAAWLADGVKSVVNRIAVEAAHVGHAV